MKLFNSMLCAGALSLLVNTSVAEVFGLSGVITEGSGALASLAPVDTPFSGDGNFEANALTEVQVILSGFCFTDDGFGLPPASPTCGALGKSAVPVLVTGQSLYDGTPAAPGSTFQQAGTDFNVETGGTLEIISYSPTFGINIYITLLFNDDGTGSLTAVTDTLGTVSGDLSWEPVIVPVPAAVWLFGSSILGLVAVKRRQSK